MMSRLSLALAISAALAFSSHVMATDAPASTPIFQNAKKMTTTLPLFFNALVALDTQQHRTLTLPEKRKDFAFAAKSHMAPLTVAEVPAAVHQYPLVFIQEGDVVALVALTGLPDTGNRFVNAKGEWRAGAYIPAYVRAYPFIAVRPNKDAQPVIAFDPNAVDFKTKNGQLLIDKDGQPGEQLKGILAYLGEYQQLAERTHKMALALKSAGVLEDGQMQIQPPQGKATQIGGFLVVNEAKLRALPPEKLKQLMDEDVLGLAYAQLFSMGNLGHIAGEAPQAPAVQNTNGTPRRRTNKKTAE